MSISIRSESSSGSCTSLSSNLDRLSDTAVYGSSYNSTESEQLKNSKTNDSSSNNNTEIDRLSSNYSKSNESSLEHSNDNSLDNDNQWHDYIYENYGYMQQFSFDPGISSSESDGDYERMVEARKSNQLELELKKIQHETSFNEIPRPNWQGMGLKRWNHNKIILRFYVQQIVNSDTIDDNRYNVYLKPNPKFKWHVRRSSAPPETDVRKPFMLPDGVTNENLIEAIEHVYANIKRFAKRSLLIRQSFHYSFEEVD